MKNRKRTEHAREALEGYVKRDDVLEVCPEHVTDLLADLMHFCDRHGVDFGKRLSSAENHYLEER